MATNGAPDNWEDEDMDVSNKLSALNVNAATFVPNPNAAVFVPSWGPEAAAPKSENKDNGKMAVDEPSPVEAGPPPPGPPAPPPAASGPRRGPSPAAPA